jgi:hypothetical protein
MVTFADLHLLHQAHHGQAFGLVALFLHLLVHLLQSCDELGRVAADGDGDIQSRGVVEHDGLLREASPLLESQRPVASTRPDSVS